MTLQTFAEANLWLIPIAFFVAVVISIEIWRGFKWIFSRPFEHSPKSSADNGPFANLSNTKDLRSNLNNPLRRAPFKTREGYIDYT